MEKLNLIETLGKLCVYLGHTTIKRLEDRYVVESNYAYNDGYFQYDVCHYDNLNAEVDLDGNILSAYRACGQEFWNGGGEMSDQRSAELGDDNWEFPDSKTLKAIVSNRANEILALKPGEEITITREECSEHRRQANKNKEV